MTKADKKLQFAQASLEKLEKSMESPAYAKKPEEVKTKDSEKVRSDFSLRFFLKNSNTDLVGYFHRLESTR